MSIHPSEEELLEYALAPLSGTSALTEHLESCELCQQLTKQFSQILQNTKTLATLRTPDIHPQTHQAILDFIHSPSPARSPFRPFIPFALTAALLFGILGLFTSVLFQKNTPNLSLSTNSSPSPSTTNHSPSSTDSAPAPFSSEDKDLNPKESLPIEENSAEKEIEPSSDASETPSPTKEDPSPTKEDPSTEEEKTPEKRVPVLPETTTIELCGDLNQNGRIDPADPLLLLRSLESRQQISLKQGDLNEDGEVNFLDAHLLYQSALKA